jgi:hypothetical protein
MKLGSKISGRKHVPKTHCKRGHPLSGDNVYICGGKRVCRECCRGRQHGYDLANPWRNCPRLYNLSVAQVEEKSRTQGNVCAVCKRPCKVNRVLSVDHDHSCCPGPKSCGKCVRDLLCYRCNTVLGRVEENRELLLNLVEYLDKWNK